MKPLNILLSSEDGQERAVLTDLGSVSTARVNITTRQQALTAEDEASCKTSAAYRAPELTSVPQPPVTIDEKVYTYIYIYTYVMMMHYISRSFIFPVVMSVLDWLCVFIREMIQIVDFVTHML
jgi:serine/threonine protein kinase